VQFKKPRRICGEEKDKDIEDPDEDPGQEYVSEARVPRLNSGIDALLHNFRSPNIRPISFKGLEIIGCTSSLYCLSALQILEEEKM
jgi:hypothetical protein